MISAMKLGFPFKEKAKKKNKSDVPATKERTTAAPDFLELAIEKTEEGELVGVHGERCYNLLDSSKVSEGDVWKCMIGKTPGNLHRFDAVPTEFIRKTEHAQTQDKSATPETANPTNMEDCLKKIRQLEMQLTAAQEELKEKNRKLSLANLKAGRLEKTIRSIPDLKEEIKGLKVANDSLKMQVKALEKKNLEADIQNISLERDHYKGLYEAQEAIIGRLRETIAVYESGKKDSGTTVTTFLTGPTGIHCNLLEDGNYRVYFSPGRKTLRFVPNEDGEVECHSREVLIPAIGGFTSFEKIRPLDTTNDGGEIVVSLC